MPIRRGRIPDFIGQEILALRKRVVGSGRRLEPAETVEEYLARGGKIKVCPPGRADEEEMAMMWRRR